MHALHVIINVSYNDIRSNSIPIFPNKTNKTKEKRKQNYSKQCDMISKYCIHNSASAACVMQFLNTKHFCFHCVCCVHANECIQTVVVDVCLWIFRKACGNRFCTAINFFCVCERESV